MTIAEFLLARIAEDEAGADTAIFGSRRAWDVTDADQSVVTGAGVETPCWEVAQHIARHDPARVLAECKAKRRIVNLHEGSAEDGCEACYPEWEGDALYPTELSPWPCENLLALASVYADHPDFDPAWRSE